MNGEFKLKPNMYNAQTCTISHFAKTNALLVKCFLMKQLLWKAQISQHCDNVHFYDRQGVYLKYQFKHVWHTQNSTAYIWGTQYVTLYYTCFITHSCFLGKACLVHPGKPITLTLTVYFKDHWPINLSIGLSIRMVELKISNV